MKVLPEDAQERKKYPVKKGGLDYFPLTFKCLMSRGYNILDFPKSLCAIAYQSYLGHIQHYDSSEKLHWDQSRSSDNEDALLRHLLDGELKPALWRACACVELLLLDNHSLFINYRHIVLKDNLLLAFINGCYLDILIYLLQEFENK